MDAADGGDATFQGIVGRALETHRRRLGHAIGDGHFAHVHLVVDALHHLDRAGRARHDAGAQRFQVEARKLGMIEFGDEHRRHAVERGAFFLFDRLQRRQRIKTFAGIDHGRAERDGSEIAHHHAKAVIERHGNADAVLFRQPHRAADEIAVVEDVVMRQRHALGRARGAAGELDIHRIVELQRRSQFGKLLAVPRAAHFCHVLEGEGARTFGAADLDHRAQLRQPRCLQFARLRCGKLRQQRVQHLHVVGGLERGCGNDRRAADFCECEFKLAQAVRRIDGNENEPGLGGGELRQRPFRPIERPHPDPRAALEAEREKARRQRVDARGELFPGPAHVMAWRNQRLAIAPARGGLIEAAADGVAEQRRVGSAADVAVEGVGQGVILHASSALAPGSRHHIRVVIASEAKQSIAPQKEERIASSLALPCADALPVSRGE